MDAQGRQLSGGVESIIGVSHWAQRIRAEILRVAVHDADVLITGPSGTGKELIARAVHAHSRRAGAPFVAVDCAALAGELFVSQMFGHVKGSFTGAHFSSLGAFRAAEGGTVFLDEIGELDIALQVKLLRVLQEKTVVPLGSHEGTRVDIRIIAATNRDLEHDVRQGRFRTDLFYRLNVVSLTTEPLCERPDDIEVLARHYLHKLAIEGGLPLKRLSPQALDRARLYRWPGNVRELLNILERAAIFCDDDVLPADAFPTPDGTGSLSPPPRFDIPSATDPPAGADGCSREHSIVPTPAGDGHWLTMAEVERAHIVRTLEYTRYNQSQAARLLNMDRHALRRKIKEFGVRVGCARRGHPASHAN